MSSNRFISLCYRFVRTSVGILTTGCVIAFVCGLFVNSHAYVWLAAFVAILGIGSIWPVLSIAGALAVCSWVSSTVVEGNSVAVHIRIKNRLPCPLIGLEVTGLDILPIALPAIAPRQTLNHRIDVELTQRGIWPRTELTIGTSFPFNVLKRSRPIEILCSLLTVCPLRVNLGRKPVFREKRGLLGAISQYIDGGDGEVAGTRLYRRGDSLRKIHWAQSARHDRLIATDTNASFRPAIHLILDHRSESHVGVGRNASLEWAIRIAAGIYTAWTADGVAVTLSGVDRILARPSDRLSTVLKTLALLNSTDKALSHIVPNCGNVFMVTTDLGVLHGDSFPRETRGHISKIVLRSEGFGGSPVEMKELPWLFIRSWNELSSAIGDAHAA